MPSYEEVNAEINACPSPATSVRHKYLDALAAYTKRATLLYAANPAAPGMSGSVNNHDVQSLMAAMVGLKGEKLDLVLHSNGGSPEAAEQIVTYLRAKFSHIRVIVPQNAMSAATMLACAADEIVLGRHSALGPIDPQVRMGDQFIPAQAILDEYKTAQGAVGAGGGQATLWVAKFQQIPPGFITHCESLVMMAKGLVADWLARFMFTNEEDPDQAAREVSEWLGNAKNHRTHGRPISFEQAQEKGMNVTRLEDDGILQDMVLSLHHSVVSTFQREPQTVKIVENQAGKGDVLRMVTS